MAEQFDLTTPENVQNYRVTALLLYWDKQIILITLVDEDGREYNHVYKGTEATDLMVALNKADLSTNSLQKRILSQLATDGKINAGSVSGTPD